MFRFFTIKWDASDPEQCAIAVRAANRLRTVDGRWRVSVDEVGFAAFHASARSICPHVHLLAGNRGLIVGEVYPQHAGVPDGCALPPELDEGTSGRIFATAGRSLIDDYWGSYVAFIHGRQQRRLWVLRSPRANLPCFFASLGGVGFFFSRVEDCARLQLIPFSVNWKRVVSRVVDGAIASSKAAINEISEINEGECVEDTGLGLTRHIYWSAYLAARKLPLEDIEEAASRMREVVRYSAASWTFSHSTILHTLSGGIDSTITASCLRDAREHLRVICLNQHSAGANGDERAYARLAAQRFGLELFEHPRNPMVDLRQIEQSIRTAIPSSCILELVTARPAIELARELGATAVTTGSHGDVTFHMRPALPAAADFLKLHGLRPSIFKVALDAARIENLSVWKVLQQAVRYRVSGSHESFGSIRNAILQKVRGSEVLNRDLVAARGRDDAETDPEQMIIADLPPGKLWHIYQMTVPSYEDPFSHPDDAELIHPLSSQPLAELCLRIPIYIHLRGGWDRAVARRAFADDLPREIARRVTKGGQEEHIKRILKNNLEFVRETLLHGMLVRENVLNRKVLLDALSERPTRSYVLVGRLMSYLGVEIWLRHWNGGRVSQAA